MIPFNPSLLSIDSFQSEAFYRHGFLSIKATNDTDRRSDTARSEQHGSKQASEWGVGSTESRILIVHEWVPPSRDERIFRPTRPRHDGIITRRPIQGEQSPIGSSLDLRGSTHPYHYCIGTGDSEKEAPCPLRTERLGRRRRTSSAEAAPPSADGSSQHPAQRPPRTGR
jgi:hypothetical protein